MILKKAFLKICVPDKNVVLLIEKSVTDIKKHSAPYKKKLYVKNTLFLKMQYFDKNSVADPKQSS